MIVILTMNEFNLLMKKVLKDRAESSYNFEYMMKELREGIGITLIECRYVNEQMMFFYKVVNEKKFLHSVMKYDIQYKKNS